MKSHNRCPLLFPQKFQIPGLLDFVQNVDVPQKSKMHKCVNIVHFAQI